MINQTLDTVAKLQGALIIAEDVVSAFPKETPYQDFLQRSFVYLLVYFLHMFAF